MADLIERSAAMDALTDKNIIDHMDSVQDGELHRVKRATQRIMAQLPAVDAVPVRHGRWIHCEETDRFYEHWSCSVCGHDIIENPSFENFITGERLDFLFCPYCGAKMDGKDEA